MIQLLDTAIALTTRAKIPRCDLVGPRCQWTKYALTLSPTDYLVRRRNGDERAINASRPQNITMNRTRSASPGELRSANLTRRTIAPYKIPSIIPIKETSACGVTVLHRAESSLCPTTEQLPDNTKTQETPGGNVRATLKNETALRPFELVSTISLTRVAAGSLDILRVRREVQKRSHTEEPRKD